MNAMTYARKPQAASAVSALKIGRPDDAFEHEADRVADEVMSSEGTAAQWSISRMSIAPPLQAKYPCDGSEGSVGEYEGYNAKEALQGKPPGAVETDIAPPIVHDVLNSPGQPLDKATRDFFEPKFGYDFSRVRVHTDATAAESARAVHTAAYTTGEHLVFGAGQYTRTTAAGLRLLGHELTHIIQQRGEPLLRSGALENPAASAGIIQRQPEATAPPASLGQSVTEATQKVGAPSTLQRLTFEGDLAAGQTLVSDSDKTIHTFADTHVTISVSATELQVLFRPGLIITSSTWPHPDLDLTQASFDFTKGTFGFDAGGPNYAWWLGNAKQKLTDGLATLFGHLPDPMRTPGYNPFTDPNIQGNLASFFSSLSTGGSTPETDVPKATGNKISGTIVLGGEIRQSSGRLSLVVPSGTNVTVTVALSGGIPTRLRDVRVSSINLSLWNPGKKNSSVEFHVQDAGFPLIFLTSATFSAGGHLQFSYTLASEVLEAAWKALIAGAAIASGQGNKVGEGAADYNQPQARALVDSVIQSTLEPLLQNLILANRHAIPGMDLGEALGFPELGDFPTPEPGRASG